MIASWSNKASQLMSSAKAGRGGGKGGMGGKLVLAPVSTGGARKRPGTGATGGAAAFWNCRSITVTWIMNVKNTFIFYAVINKSYYC